MRRRRGRKGENENDDDAKEDDNDDPNKKLKRPRGKRPPGANFIVHFIQILWTYITFIFSFSMDVVVFFSPSTKSRHRARGHQNHHQHDGKEVNVNPADINDAEFYDFVQSSQQMMMEEIGKQKRQQKSNMISMEQATKL